VAADDGQFRFHKSGKHYGNVRMKGVKTVKIDLRQPV